MLLVFHICNLGKTEFGSDEDAHVVGDCVKVIFSVHYAICGYPINVHVP